MSVLQIHESTLATLSEVEKFFLELFVKDGRAVVIPDVPIKTTRY